MKLQRFYRKAICFEFIAILLFSSYLWNKHASTVTTSDSVNTSETPSPSPTESEPKAKSEKDFIKWVDFNVTLEALEQAYKLDVESQTESIKLNWIELLAYVASTNGGSFKNYKKSQMTELSEKLKSGEETMDSLTKDQKYYSYYLEAYTAVLGGLVGEYEIETLPDESSKEKKWKKVYGLKGYSPLAKNYYYTDYDDFGVSRSYGYKRNHLGHDLIGQTGSPVIAVESGYVEAIGWNQYGGWRLGIRSFDKKRYYYYAHLRQNFPYNKSLREGSIVTAGDVIGYLGHTGYSKKENVNNIDTPHLHFGLQLIFDESQKEGVSEIWVDCYSLVRFLSRNRSETVKDLETKEYSRIFQMKDPIVEQYLGSSEKTFN